MKPNPFYKDEKERLELMLKRDAFTFSQPDTQPKLAVLIAGREGSGKTHLACTMNELGPVYVIDTEYRAQIVTRKFKNIRFTLVRSFTEMVIAVKHILKHQPPGTIVIDSGSDLQTFAEIAYLDRTKLEKVYPVFNWADVWGMCNAVIDEIRFSQNFHLVVTARVKEEYLNDRATGNIIPRIYSTLPYKADVVLQFALQEKQRQLLVTKNGFVGNLSQTLQGINSLPTIIKQLSDGTPITQGTVVNGVPLRKVS